MGISLILLLRARTGIALSMCGWVCVYAPTWPGTSFFGYPFLDLKPEKWVGGYEQTVKDSFSAVSTPIFEEVYSPWKAVDEIYKICIYASFGEKNRN